jgi:hypothetical protein
MPSSANVPIDRPIAANVPRREAVVQDRPSLGNLPRTKRGLGWWLLPAIDLLASCVALMSVVLASGLQLFPALPVAPVLLIVVNSALGVYGPRPSRGMFGTENGMAWPVIRILAAALFAWSASLLTPLDGLSQLALLALFIVLDGGMRMMAAPVLQRVDRVERWVLVGDQATADRLRAFQPLRAYATIVCTVPLTDERSETASRVAALEVVDRCGADRVVIGSQHADDEGLLGLVRAFRSIGVPVSLLPRPLDLLEAPAATPSEVGGVPLIDVEALATRGATPYTGPDRRRDRRTKVSVVVPAMNEAENVGHVLRRLPRDVHEVILVDGNSHDETAEVAREACPGIRVLTQSGRGKGDALRTGFAAVTGNLVVMLDADGSADPAEIPRFVDALESGADFAKGSRFLEGGGSADITRLRRLGNTFLSGSANLLHGTHFTDLCYGYNAFWARCLPFISLDAPGFEVETLINLRIASSGMSITEVPSYEAKRLYGQSNLKTFRDGFRVLGTILSEARRRRSIHRQRPGLEGESQKAKAAATAA